MDCHESCKTWYQVTGERISRHIVRNNREYLGAVIDVVRLLGKQGIAFRGHLEGEYSSNKGNFLEVMGLLSKYTPIVEEKLNRKDVKYTPAQIQNELIKIIASRVRREIVNEVSSARFFSLQVDETKDLSKTEQI